MTNHYAAGVNKVREALTPERDPPREFTCPPRQRQSHAVAFVQDRIEGRHPSIDKGELDSGANDTGVGGEVGPGLPFGQF